MHVGVFPANPAVTALSTESSPCTWGCFQLCPITTKSTQVFPMHVGVFLKGVWAKETAPGLPHARGGVSSLLFYCPFWGLSSPCTWGCFSLEFENLCLELVFPMHVGVFLPRIRGCIRSRRLPHARGGVSRRWR